LFPIHVILLRETVCWSRRTLVDLASRRTERWATLSWMRASRPAYTRTKSRRPAIPVMSFPISTLGRGDSWATRRALFLMAFTPTSWGMCEWREQRQQWTTREYVYPCRSHRWAGCGDGIHIWNPRSGELLGKILLPGGKGVANFCWAGPVQPREDSLESSIGHVMSRVLLFAEDELWEACVAVNGHD
jgi:hypothetical protein